MLIHQILILCLSIIFICNLSSLFTHHISITYYILYNIIWTYPDAEPCRCSVQPHCCMLNGGQKPSINFGSPLWFHPKMESSSLKDGDVHPRQFLSGPVNTSYDGLCCRGCTGTLFFQRAEIGQFTPMKSHFWESLVIEPFLRAAPYVLCKS